MDMKLKTGFSFGSSWEQYDDVYFSPTISNFYEKLDTNQTASDKLKKQEGEYLDTLFRYSFTVDKGIKDTKPRMDTEVHFHNPYPLFQKIMLLLIVMNFLHLIKLEKVKW